MITHTKKFWAFLVSLIWLAYLLGQFIAAFV
jgi:hypothetical protein